jgi:phosphate transport system substrate-binding protein
MVSRRVALSLVVIALAVAPGCERRGGSGAGGLTIAGSTSVQPYAEKWVEEYRKRHPDIEISVQGGGSTAGVQATINGAAEIGASSRPLKPAEKTRVKATTVARDAEAIIVHPSNRVGDLTLAQVRGIYAGEISSWKEVGGADAGINVVTREIGSGSRGSFEELAMARRPILAAALVQDSQGAVRQMVSSDANAIGYVSHGVVDASVKPLAIGGIQASQETVLAGQYPLVRPFLLLTRGEPAGPTREFIAWVLGPEGQAIARKDGLFPPVGTMPVAP